MARMRVIGSSFDKGYRDDINYNFGLLEALIGEANGLTDNLREEMLGKINNLQQQIDMLTGENIGELLERLNDSIQQALTAAQDARTAKTATEEATALATAATELANASALLAEEKADYANDKAILAQEAADNANQEASNLSQLKLDVVKATHDANTATGNANQAAQAAQTATDAINVVLPNVTGLVNLKEWAIETQYKKNNFVTLEGNGYMALRDNKGVKPPSFPVLSNADWAMFVQKGEKGEQGTGVRILGTLPDESALPPAGEPGDAYLINGDLYVWSDTTNDWTNVGTIKGPKGDIGPQGPQGEQGPPGQDADLTEVNQEIASLQQTVTNNQKVVTEHLGQMVLTENGVHGIRYFNGELAVKDNQDQWVAVETGGSGEVYQESIIRNEKSNAIGIGTFADSTLAVSRIGGKNDTGKFFVALNPVGFAIGDNVKLKYRNSPELLDAKVTNITDASDGMKNFFLETIATLNNDLQLVVKLGGNVSYQTAMGEYTFSSGRGALAEGLATIAIGEHSHTEGYLTVAIGQFSHAEGSGGVASGYASHSQGTASIASGHSSFAGGQSSTSEGDMSFAFGQSAIAKGRNGVALGSSAKATGDNSFAANANAEAIGTHSAAIGMYTTANDFASVAIGRQNKAMTGSPTSWSTSNTAFLIGNGQGTLSNAFRVMFNGNTYGFGAWNSTGADYAEFFEWSDGNFNDEDRVGFVVALERDKIRKATNEDSYILGIISATPSVIGDSHQDDWQNKYVTDEWGRIQHHWVDVDYDEVITVYTENGPSNETVTKTRQDYVPMLNPDWNNDEEYIPREERKEWDAVGLMGKLLVRDDGTCEVNSYAKVGAEAGTLTASDDPTEMRVIERVAPNIIRVFLK